MIAQLALWWVVLVLGLVASDDQTPSTGGLTSSEQIAGEASVWAILIAIFATAFYVMLAQQILAGRTWAVAVVWIFSVFEAVTGIVGTSDWAEPGWVEALGYLAIVLYLVLVVLLPLRPRTASSAGAPNRADVTAR